jgi:hypothetical protein
MRRLVSLAGAAALIAAAGVSAVHAQPTPPTRFFGKATIDGKPAPDGTTVTAMVGSKACGTGTVTGGTYMVDVKSASTEPGCGTDGASVAFQVGSARASQTGTFQTGAFVPLDLTVSQATPTPTATPARTPTPAPTPARTPTPAATPARTPTAAPTAAAQRPAATPAAAQRPAAAPALPSTGAGTSGDVAAAWLLGGLVALAGVAGAAGVAARRRQ